MRIVFMGTPDFAVPSLKALFNAGHELAGVVTQPDRPGGRGKKLRPSPVKLAAMELGLPLWQPESIKVSDFISILKEINPVVLVVAAFGQILPGEILKLPRWGCVNVHASLLPRYRGAAPIHRAVINGETITGVTTMMMDQGLDTGDMLLKASVPIAPGDTVGMVHDRLAQIGADLLLETLEKLALGLLSPVPQDNSQASYAPMLTQSDEIICWTDSAWSIYNQIRGMDPWPGARTTLGGKVLKIWRAAQPAGGSAGNRQLAEHDGKETPGTVIEAGPEGCLMVATGTGSLLIKELQIQGGKRLPVEDFLRGNSIPVGTRLGDSTKTITTDPKGSVRQ